MSDQPRTTLYHSELVKRGALTVTVETDVLNSKYAQKPPYVMLKVDGFSRRYDTENAACAEALRGLRGKVVEIEAAGSRAEATILVRGASAAPQSHPAQSQAQPPARSQQPAPSRQQQPAAAGSASGNDADPVTNAKRTLNRLANGYGLCLAAGEYVKSEWDKDHPDSPMPNDQFQAMVSALFIEGNRRMVFNDIPTGPLSSIV
jgi:hypothetical protein